VAHGKRAARGRSKVSRRRRAGHAPPARRGRRVRAPWEAHARAARVQTVRKDLVVVVVVVVRTPTPNYLRQASPDRGKYLFLSFGFDCLGLHSLCGVCAVGLIDAARGAQPAPPRAAPRPPRAGPQSAASGARRLLPPFRFLPLSHPTRFQYYSAWLYQYVLIKRVSTVPSSSSPASCACICGQTLQEFQPVLLPLKQLAYLLLNSYSKLCDEETACGQCLASWRHPSCGCVTVQRWLAVAYFAHPVYLQYA